MIAQVLIDELQLFRDAEITRVFTKDRVCTVRMKTGLCNVSLHIQMDRNEVDVEMEAKDGIKSALTARDLSIIDEKGK